MKKKSDTTVWNKNSWSALSKLKNSTQNVSMIYSIFAFLVLASHKEPMKLSYFQRFISKVTLQ